MYHATKIMLAVVGMILGLVIATLGAMEMPFGSGATQMTIGMIILLVSIVWGSIVTIRTIRALDKPPYR